MIYEKMIDEIMLYR